MLKKWKKKTQITLLMSMGVGYKPLCITNNGVYHHPHLLALTLKSLQYYIQSAWLRYCSHQVPLSPSFVTNNITMLQFLMVTLLNAILNYCNAHSITNYNKTFIQKQFKHYNHLTNNFWTCVLNYLKICFLTTILPLCNHN
jgi:hypothetical protein